MLFSKPILILLHLDPSSPEVAFINQCDYCEKLLPRKDLYNHIKICQAKKFAKDLQGMYAPDLLEQLYPLRGPAVEVVNLNDEAERSMADMVNNPPFTQLLRSEPTINSTDDEILFSDISQDDRAEVVPSFTRQLRV